MDKSKRVFALIGGIASGKTAVSDILASLGAHIIDADIITREVTKTGEGEKVYEKLFPDCVNGKTVDRARIRERIFSDEKARKALNDALHPLIIDEIHRKIEKASGVVVVVMPIPKELRRYHAVLNVYTPLEKRIDRLIKRDNIGRELAEKIIASQLSDEEAAAKSDFTFVNDGDLEKLKTSVTKWWYCYIEN